jgi:hypothetical protein
VEEV